MNEVCVVPGCGRPAWFHAGRMLLCKAHVVSVVAASKAETEPAPTDEGAEAYRAAVMQGAETGDRTPDLRFTNPEAPRRCAGERTDDQGSSWWACTKDVGHEPPHEDVNGIKWQGPGWMTRARAHSEGSPPSPEGIEIDTVTNGPEPKGASRCGNTSPNGQACDRTEGHGGRCESYGVDGVVLGFWAAPCARCKGYGVALVEVDGGTRSVRERCPTCRGSGKTRCADESPSGYLCTLGLEHEGKHKSSEGGTWQTIAETRVEPAWFALQDLGEYGEKWQWSEVERLSSVAAAIRGEVAGIRKAAPADHLCVSALELPASTRVGRYFVWCDLENRWLEVTACLMSGRALPLREHLTGKGPEELGRIIERLVELGLVAKVKA